MGTKLTTPRDGRVHICANEKCVHPEGTQVKAGQPAVHIDSNGNRTGRGWYHKDCYVDAKGEPIPVDKADDAKSSRETQG